MKEIHKASSSCAEKLKDKQTIQQQFGIPKLWTNINYSSAPDSKNIVKGVFEKYFEKKGLKGGNSLKDL